MQVLYFVIIFFCIQVRMFSGVLVPFADNNHLSVLIVFRLQKFRVLFLFYHEDKKLFAYLLV